jgi:3-oxoadipate enol-lactonase
MAMININGLEHYYEQAGEGQPLVFVHGAFADARMWDPQWDYFSPGYRVIRYDLRGHGRTGSSSLEHYSMDTFADDLKCLLDALDISQPVICGQSWGGSIAQAFAVRNPERLKALVVAGSSVAIDLTLVDKILCYILVPKWVMLSAIRMLSVEKFTRLSIWLARMTQGKEWLSQGKDTQEYLEKTMQQMDKNEYLKIWDAIYGFHVLPLERITCPTRVLNGEYESKRSLNHTREILRRVPHARARMIHSASHASNIDNPLEFNTALEEFFHT